MDYLFTAPGSVTSIPVTSPSNSSVTVTGWTKVTTGNCFESYEMCICKKGIATCSNDPYTEQCKYNVSYGILIFLYS